MRLGAGYRGAFGVQARPYRTLHAPQGIRAAVEDTTTGKASEEESKLQQFKLVGPEPKRFTPAEGQLLDVAQAAFPSLTRLGSGGFVYGYRPAIKTDDARYALVKAAGRKVEEASDVISTFKRPEKSLVLYEFEGCPYCRKVREALMILDLDALVLPCPKDGPTYRSQAVEKGGKAQFPYLEDPNTGKAMYESDEIIRYLFETYGPGADQVPRLLTLGTLTTLTAGVGLMARGRRGSAYKKSRVAADPSAINPIIYYGYELSPFCKLVREALSELELPHLYRSTPRGSPKRQELFEKRGLFQAPYIEDPNKGIAMFESAAIVRYLYHEYGQETGTAAE